MKRLGLLMALLLLPLTAFAAEGTEILELNNSWVGIASVVLFFIAYLAVMAEEFTHLRKSKPVMLAAGIIWGLIAWYYQAHDVPHVVETALRHNLEEYAELMLFLIVAMTYINAMEERKVFEALRSWLVHKGFGYRTLFWVTGILAFFISSVADNLTTALLMGAVVMAVGHGN
ncbi:MAG: sodium:proton antiporter NhaD, partial [Gallionella sp.]|nr:sodium:proton antiporter NhaD [Gallionella sp.]